MKQVIRILIVEDVSTDVELIQRALKKLDTEISLDITQNESGFEEKLRTFTPDIILLDYALEGGFTGLDAIEIVKSHKLTTPIIIVSGSIGEERAVELFQKGAVDFVSKQKLDRLVPAIRRVLNELEEKRKLTETEAQLHTTNEMLKKKLNDLERLNKSMVGRELKMIELKNEIKQLKHAQEKKDEST